MSHLFSFLIAVNNFAVLDSEATTTAAPEAASARSAAAEEEADLPSTGGPINCSYPHITVSHILAPFFNLPFTLFFF